MYDVVIIGAGVTGSAIARELSRYQYKTIVLDKNSDVCEGTSKANSGIVHAGFDNEPGSVMAKMNVRGNAMMEQLSKDLDFSFKRNGSLVLCFDEKDMDKLEHLVRLDLPLPWRRTPAKTAWNFSLIQRWFILPQRTAVMCWKPLRVLLRAGS